MITGKKDIPLPELETPMAGDNDIVVRNLDASICGADVAAYHHGPNPGQRVTAGGQFGYEMVPQVGKNAKDIHVGDRRYPWLDRAFHGGLPGRMAFFPQKGENTMVFGSGTIGIDAAMQAICASALC